MSSVLDSVLARPYVQNNRDSKYRLISGNGQTQWAQPDGNDGLLSLVQNGKLDQYLPPYTPGKQVVASGGTITYANGYKFHTFTAALTENFTDYAVTDFQFNPTWNGWTWGYQQGIALINPELGFNTIIPAGGVTPLSNYTMFIRTSVSPYTGISTSPSVSIPIGRTMKLTFIYSYNLSNGGTVPNILKVSYAGTEIFSTTTFSSTSWLPASATFTTTTSSGQFVFTSGNGTNIGDSIQLITAISLSENLNVTSGGSVAALVVGGGGGGGNNCGGGGGAAGVDLTTSSLSAKSYPVVVASGGSGGYANYNGTSGGSSTFNSLTGIGGGYGGGYAGSLHSGGDGGCGGGGFGGSQFVSFGGAAQQAGGHVGGDGAYTYSGGGGGGMGTVGLGGNGNFAGNGGNGASYVIGGVTLTVAGGGGGGSFSPAGGNYGVGGSGGGGNGAANSGNSGVDATFYGSGGGGSAGGGGAYLGGQGYQGLVIIAYPAPLPLPTRVVFSGFSWFNQGSTDARPKWTFSQAGVAPTSLTALLQSTPDGVAPYTTIETVSLSSSALFYQYTGATVANRYYRATITASADVAPASGGTITDANGFRTHTFTSGTSNFVINPGFILPVTALVVGGGGGGAGAYFTGGGGGGGAVLTAATLSPKTYSVIVGNGGAGGAGGGYNNGSNGQDSSFNGVTGTGGGGGAFESTNGLNGGCGGGAGYYSVTNGGTGSQGQNGGKGIDNVGGVVSGGGGGGMGAAAGSTGTINGFGGNGATYKIGGISYTVGGGGGAGSSRSSPNNNPGGTGGGGTGAIAGGIGVTSGTPNTGGGGGGTTSNFAGGAGGSGIVIISYPFNTTTSSFVSQQYNQTPAPPVLAFQSFSWQGGAGTLHPQPNWTFSQTGGTPSSLTATLTYSATLNGTYNPVDIAALANDATTYTYTGASSLPIDYYYKVLIEGSNLGGSSSFTDTQWNHVPVAPNIAFASFSWQGIRGSTTASPRWVFTNSGDAPTLLTALLESSVTSGGALTFVENPTLSNSALSYTYAGATVQDLYYKVTITATNAVGTSSFSNVEQNLFQSTVATGGNVTNPTTGFFAGKRVHTFTASGTFTLTTVSIASPVINTLIVGGGGGGGNACGGGGGGSYPVINAPTLSTGIYNVVVGLGGDGGAFYGADGLNGQDTTITKSGGGYSDISIGGGGGGFFFDNGNDGQSGGGAGGSGSVNPSGGNGSLGFQGGSTNPLGFDASGGGGGAGSAGQMPPSQERSGNGGSGLRSTGETYFGAGGGGGAYTGYLPGDGGSRGTGGQGGFINAPGSNGTQNSGSGGGGGPYTGEAGGNGGSGIAIFYYTYP